MNDLIDLKKDRPIKLENKKNQLLRFTVLY